MLSEGAGRWLHTSGVVPVAPDGSVPAGVAEQADVVWANIAAILAEAEMAVGDVVSVTTYVVAGEDLAPVMAARDRAMAGHLAASTLVTVPALARPRTGWRSPSSPRAVPSDLLADASDRAPARKRQHAACVAGERSGGPVADDRTDATNGWSSLAATA